MAGTASIRNTPPWADWLTALVAAVVVLNLNVTHQGDPLSGMTESTRIVFYAVLAIIGAIAVGFSVLAALLAPGTADISRRAAIAFSFVSFSGLAGILLDQRNGPVSTVQLLAYVALFMGLIRFARLIAEATAVAESSNTEKQTAANSTRR